MQSSSDSSIWRSLAVAFGDGLAFGVGVKLSQNAARQIGAAQRIEPGGLGERLSQLEQTIRRIERTPQSLAAPEQKSGLDQKVLEAIVNALEARLKEHAGQVDRQLADLEAKLTLELKGLDEQGHSIAAKVTGNLAALEEKMVAVNREFGAEVARIVAEQLRDQSAAAQQSIDEKIAAALDTAVEQRVAQAVHAAMDPLERQLAEADTRTAHQIDATVRERLDPLEHTLAEMDIRAERYIATAVRERLEPFELQLRGEIAGKEREIAELQRRLAEADTNLLEIVSGIGQVCRQAAERMAKPAPPALPNSLEAAHPLETVATESQAPAADPSAEDDPIPGFAQPQKPNRLWRVPLVSSLVVLASGGLLLIRYL